jgi:hypothetical protein
LTFEDVGETGSAQAAEITIEDKMVAGKIDLITSLLLHTSVSTGSETSQVIRFFATKDQSISGLLRIPHEPASRDTPV